MSDPDDPRANLKARLELVALLHEHLDEAQAAGARVARKIELHRKEVLHRRRSEVQDTLIGIERAKRKALRWLTTRSPKHRPPRFEDIRGISASRGFNVSRTMAAYGICRLKNSKARKQVLADLAKVDSFEAYLDIYARKWLRSTTLPDERRPSADDLKRQERDVLTRTEDACAQTGFLIARELAELLAQRVDAPRIDADLWEAAVMLVVALEPSQSAKALGIVGLKVWGESVAGEVFSNPQEIVALIQAHLPGQEEDEVLSALHGLVDATRMTLHERAVLREGTQAAHLSELRAAQDEGRKAAERRIEIIRLCRLAWDCTRHGFPTWFLPMLNGENVVQWMKRVDWEAYPRDWFSHSIRPFLRELDLRIERLHIDIDDLLRYEPDAGDSRLQGIRSYTADLVLRAYASLDDPQKQMDLEEELVKTFAEDDAGRERYHDYFEHLYGRLERLVHETPTPKVAAKADEEVGDEHTLTPQDEKVLRWIARQVERKLTAEIARATGINEKAIGKSLVRLKEVAYIENPGRQGYLPTESGKARAARIGKPF